MRDEHILSAVFAQPWAILPAKLQAMQAVVLRHLSGVRLSAEQLQDVIEAAARPRPLTQPAGGGTVAILPVMGVISQRMNMLSAFSGGTSTEQLGREFGAIIADPTISAVVLDVDSPGGSVFGVQELWDQIYAARGSKPIVAVANSMAASAAYYIASAADEIVVTPSGEVGAIGVIATHYDESQLLSNEGVKVSFITAGKYKAEGNSAEPLDDEARAYMQQRVNDYYGMFVNSVAKGRGVSAAQVRSGMGQGRMLGAKDAKAAGMVDRVETLDQTITRLLGRGAAPSLGRPGALALEAGAATDFNGTWVETSGTNPGGYTVTFTLPADATEPPTDDDGEEALRAYEEQLARLRGAA